MLSALCYALYKPCRGWRPRQPAPVCLLNPAITPAKEEEGELPARLYSPTWFVINNPATLETGRRISAKQKLRCSPTGIRQLCCKIAPLFADIRFALDRIAVQIVLLRYFFCLISYFYMLLILQSAPSRLSPNEALPHTPLGALPLDPTSPPAPSLSVRFISRFARCLGAALLIPHS